jgi:serine/threonine protein kinase
MSRADQGPADGDFREELPDGKGEPSSRSEPAPSHDGIVAAFEKGQAVEVPDKSGPAPALPSPPTDQEDSGGFETLSTELARQVDEVCQRFEAAWKKHPRKGQRPLIEDYLNAIPEQGRSALLMELLALEIAYRHRCGEAPTLREYRGRFPGLDIRSIASKFTTAPSTLFIPPPTQQAPMINAGQTDPAIKDYDLLLTIPGLEIQGKIGHGGMGSVYKAYQRALDRYVALKTVRPELLSQQGLALFHREARLLASLRHPQIVRILEFHPEHDVPYFLMEYVDGVPLDRALRGRSWQERALLFKEVVATTVVAHDQGVVHGDLKPANILVDRQFKPYILDFGLGRFTQESLKNREEGGNLGGTPAYLAPEVIQGTAPSSFQSDVYALGVTLYVVLTGVLPFQSREQLLRGEVRLPMEHDPDIPDPLQRICLKAMERRPEDRYQNADQMLQDLERFCARKPVFVRPTLYMKVLEGRVKNHTAEIRMWEKEGLISRREMDTLLKPYGRVLEPDSPWLSQARKVLGGPFLIRVGAWLFLVSAVLWPVYYWERLGQAARLATSGLPTLLMVALGIGLLRSGNWKSAVACLGSFVLLLLVFIVVLLSEFRWLQFHQSPGWEFWGNRLQRHPIQGSGGQRGTFTEAIILSNTQIFTTFLIVTLCIALLLHYLQAVFFASWLVVSSVALYTSGLLLLGARELFLENEIASVAIYYIIVSPVLFCIGGMMESHRVARAAGPFYRAAVGIFLVAAVAMAFFGTKEWFKQTWEIDNEIWNLWLISYSIPFFLCAWLCERFGTEAQRSLAWFLYLLVPIFVLVPLNMLYLDRGPIIATIGRHPVHLYELLHLPACITLLVIGRVLRIEIFIVSALAGLAVFVFRVTSLHFENYLVWPLMIALIGSCLVLLGIWSPREQKPVVEGSPEDGDLPRVA